MITVSDSCVSLLYFVFLFNDTSATEISTLSLHDALPISERPLTGIGAGQFQNYNPPGRKEAWRETHNAPIQDRKSTRLNSSHRCISYAVFCLKKKKIARK